MIKITANSSESFKTIQNALNELDPTNEFLSFFKIAEQSEKDVNGITVILKNSKKFIKDLNKNKYVIYIPDALEIDSYELLPTFETVGRGRTMFYNFVMKCHMKTNNINFVIILAGFNSPSIRVTKDKYVEFTSVDSDIEDTNTSSDEIIDNVVNDTIDDILNNPTQDESVEG